MPLMAGRYNTAMTSTICVARSLVCPPTRHHLVLHGLAVSLLWLLPDVSPLPGGISLCAVLLSLMEYPALTDAYREYLDRMFDETDDLVEVDQFTVPLKYNLTALTEFADFT